MELDPNEQRRLYSKDGHPRSPLEGGSFYIVFGLQ